MSFFRSIKTGSRDTQILRGGNAPKNFLTRNMLRVERKPPLTTQNNPRTGLILGNKNVAPIQAAYVSAIAQNKISSKTNTGAATWLGKLFGG